MQRIPRTLAVVGGGVIGCEYATMFRALGVEVTLVGGQDRLLPFLDREIADRLRLQIELLGVRVRLDAYLEAVGLDGPEVARRLRSGEELLAGCVLFTMGREGATDGLALERAGLAAGARGRLAVNEHYQTAVPHIYAAGDIIGFPTLASTSMEQARVAMCHAFDLKYKSRVSPVLPMAIYTIPEIATVGESEESCRERGIPYAVGRGALPRQQPRPDHRRSLGAGEARLLGERPEAARRAHPRRDGLRAGARGPGLPALRGTIDYFIQSVFNHPTL